MKLLALFLLTLLGGISIAQDPGAIKPKQVAPDIAKEVVTENEARQVFAKAESVLLKRLRLESKTTMAPLGTSKKPVTREQVVAQYARLYDLAKPAFKLTPKPIVFEAKVLKMNSTASMNQLQMLVKAGTIAPRGPVAVGPADQLTVREFGDSMGFFLSRIAQLTHMPSPEYSPTLME